MPVAREVARRRAADRYDALWADAAPLVRRGDAAVDPWVTRQADDPRRAPALVARPAPAVADALGAFVDTLRAIEPAQYYQPREDLHVTVLALFTATADHARHLVHLDAYQDAVAEAVDGAAPFAVDFAGVTLSPAAVLAQGTPRDDTLERVRARLRAALTRRGLGATLDQRYRLETAHVTLARFAEPLGDPGAFVDALSAARGLAFGTSVVTEVELVIGDWYLSAAHNERVATYGLDGARGG